MTLEKARELLEVQANFSSGYNRNACRLILREVYTQHSPHACDSLIEEFNLEQLFGIKPGIDYSRV